ncbi:MAG: inositol monophosphatase family protein [Alphaproteobacteria bacterium]|nr:inositol monophosphatase family protein [Alphaproteobacteria bacterium]
MAIRPAIINSMVKAAEKASKRLVRDFGEIEQLQVSLKGPADFVDKAIRNAEKALREELLLARPTYGYSIPGEDDYPGDGLHCFIVAPLDGVTNFLHGIPHFAISIALRRDKELVASVVYNPISDEIFWAERGMGSYLNSRRLRVSARRDLSTALVATTMSSPHQQQAEFAPSLANLIAQVSTVRQFGSVALDLAFVAAGRSDGFFDYGLDSWSLAAGIVLIREAGGFVSDPNTHSIETAELLKRGDVLASNDALHLKLSTLLSSPRVAVQLPIHERIAPTKP